MARMASCSATLVWVYAPALNTTPFVNQTTLYVRLVVVDFQRGVTSAQFLQIVIEAAASIDSRLPAAKQVQVRAIQYQYSHCSSFYLRFKDILPSFTLFQLAKLWIIIHLANFLRLIKLNTPNFTHFCD